MEAFITCLCDEDYSTLIISGKPKKEELELSWQEIYHEFISLRGDKKSSYMLDLIKEIEYYKGKHFIVSECAMIMKIGYSRDIANELKLMGYRRKFDPANRAQYLKDVAYVESSAKKFIAKVVRLNKELEAFKKRHGGEGITRSSFDDMNAAQAAAMKTQLMDYSKVTVSLFCSVMKQFDKWIEVQNAKKNNLIGEAAP